jgi:hypothetical protein
MVQEQDWLMTEKTAPIAPLDDTSDSSNLRTILILNISQIESTKVPLTLPGWRVFQFVLEATKAAVTLPGRRIFQFVFDQSNSADSLNTPSRRTSSIRAKNHGKLERLVSHQLSDAKIDKFGLDCMKRTDAAILLHIQFGKFGKGCCEKPR